MKKLIAYTLSVLVCGISVVLAEPLVLKQATNSIPAKTLEIGLSDLNYQVDVTKFTDTAGIETLSLTNTNIVYPLYVKYAINSKIEAELTVPYISLASDSKPAGGASTTSSSSYLGDQVIGTKINLLESIWKVAGGLSVSLPFGDKKYRAGYDITPLIALRNESGPVIFNANIAYVLPGEYTDDTSQVKVKAGSEIKAGLGVEFACRNNKGLNWLGELVYSNFGESTVASVTQTGSSGSRMELDLGARYKKGNLKTKLGLGLSLGEEKYRTYDYRIIAGVTYLVNM